MAASPGGGGAVERILVEIIADASDFVNKIQESLSGGKSALNELGPVARVSAGEVKQAMQLIVDVTNKIPVGIQRAAELLVDSGEISQEVATRAVNRLEQMGQATEVVEGRFGQLLKTLGFLGRAFLGLTAFTIFRNLSQFLSQTVQEFREFSFEQFRLSVAVRGAQRRIGEQIGTMEEWLGFVQDLRAQFRIFSTQDLTAATAKVILLTRELNFTRDQMQDVVRASIILSEVTGIKVADAARRLALFLDTGYGRGLAQLGIQVSSTSVEHFALSQNIEKSWREMTRAERAAIGLAFVMQQVGAIADDAGLAVNTVQGQFLELEAAQADARLEIGQSTAALFLAWERIKTFFVTGVIPVLARAVQTGLLLMLTFYGTISAGLITLEGQLRTIKAFIEGDFEGSLEDLQQRLLEIRREAFAGIFGEIGRLIFPEGTMEDIEGGFGALDLGLDELAEETEDFESVVDRVAKQVADAFRNMSERSADALINLERKLEDIQIRLERDIAEAVRDLNRDLAEIDRDFDQRREDLIREAGREEEEIRDDTAQRILEAERRYRLDILQAEREFQLQLRQMRRRFLLELEDAVRARDARAVVQATRRHNLEVEEARERFQEEQRQREEDHKLELQEIRERGLERRREIRRDLEERLRDLEIERQIKKEERRIDFREELEDLRRQAEQRREDARRDYEQRLEDLQRYLQNRLEAIAEGLQMERDLTIEEALRLRQALMDIFGPNSGLREFFQSIMLGAISGGIADAISALGPLLPNNPNFPTGPPGFQEGGAAVADQPTTVTFGEAGRELALFVPFDRMGSFLSGLSRGAGGRTEVLISLSPGLRAEIVDEAMGGAADIIVESGG